MWCGSFFETSVAVSRKLEGQIAGLKIVGDDVGAIFLDVRLRIRLACGELQSAGRKLRCGKCVGTFDLERADDVARAFSDLEGDVDVAAAIGNRGHDLHIAESLRLVDRFEIVDAGADKLIAELARREEVLLLPRRGAAQGARTAACVLPVMRTSSPYASFLS